MTDPPRRPTVLPPTVSAPPAYRERRVRARRRADRDAHEEITFLARCLDIVAATGSAEGRLAALLELLAETAGARRAAVLADAGERRVVVAVRTREDSPDAEALATWLDASAPRSRAERAAATPAVVSLAMAAGAPPPRLVSPRPSGDIGADASPDPDAALVVLEPNEHYACLAVPSAWPVVLGFAFDDPVAAEHCPQRLPPAFVRHAGAALAAIAEALAADRELALLRAQDRERTRFVSTVAHELRTPLTGLRGYLELILDGGVDDPAVEREFLERSRDIVSSIDELVGDLVELSRIESGSLRLELDHFSVAEVGQRVVDQLAPIALERGVALEATLPPRLRAATGDRRRVEQIVRNLVGNALKFTPSGGRVELAAWFEGPLALIAVRDDGDGIAADERTRIWERFYRLPAHARITGTGLGLPIARELARAMGGDIELASVRHVGSTFLLALPGPTPVAPETLRDGLFRAAAVEQDLLDERGVRRRLHALDRRPDRAVREPARHRVRLRAIEGGAASP